MATTTLSRVQQWLMDAIGASSDEYRAPAMTPHNAMTLAAVYYSVNRIAGDIGQLPIIPYTRDGDMREPDIRSPAYRLMKYEPNPYQTANLFKEQLTCHALLWGNGRAYIRRDGNGNPIELIPLLPDRTDTVLILGEKYHITQPERDERVNLFEPSNDKRIVIEDKDCLHIMGYTYTGIEGVSVVSLARRSLGIGAWGDARAAKQMAGGYVGKIMLEAPPGAFRKEEQAKEFLESFRAAHKAGINEEEVGLLREGIKANAMQMSNDDMQFLESRTFQRQEVMLWFGLESIPGDNDNDSYASEVQKAQAYVQGTLSRHGERWKSACEKALLTDTDKRQMRRYFNVSYAAILRGTTKERYEVYQIGRQIGVLSANDVRRLEDMNPYEGGDEYSNPAITPGNNSQTTTEAPTEQPPDAPPPAQSRSYSAPNAALVLLENRLSVEENKAKNAVRSRNFLNWMDKFYPRFEESLADTLEAIGGDRALATAHCEESKRRLLAVTDVATPDNLAELIEECVSGWRNRANIILEEMELQNV